MLYKTSCCKYSDNFVLDRFVFRCHHLYPVLVHISIILQIPVQYVSILPVIHPHVTVTCKFSRYEKGIYLINNYRTTKWTCLFSYIFREIINIFLKNSYIATNGFIIIRTDKENINNCGISYIFIFIYTRSPDQGYFTMESLPRVTLKLNIWK